MPLNVMLKFAIEREQSQACLNCAEREQIEQSKLVSASGSEPFLVLLRGQILKQVQDDHLLWAIVICYIEENRIISVCKDGNINSRGFLNPWNN